MEKIDTDYKQQVRRMWAKLFIDALNVMQAPQKSQGQLSTSFPGKRPWERGWVNFIN